MKKLLGWTMVVMVVVACGKKEEPPPPPPPNPNPPAPASRWNPQEMEGMKQQCIAQSSGYSSGGYYGSPCGDVVKCGGVSWGFVNVQVGGYGGYGSYYGGGYNDYYGFSYQQSEKYCTCRLTAIAQKWTYFEYTSGQGGYTFSAELANINNRCAGEASGGPR